MLWELIRTSQWDGSFEHPKQMLKLTDIKKTFTILCPDFLFMWIYIKCLHMSRPLVKSVYQKKKISYFSTKPYVVGTQKNRLNETVLLNTQNIC